MANHVSKRDEDTLKGLRETANTVEKSLQDFVKKLCPGEHNPTQHRDAKPPWCKACGRTARGLLIRE